MSSTLKNLRKRFDASDAIVLRGDECRVFELPSASATVLDLVLQRRVPAGLLLEIAYYAAEEDLCELMRAVGALAPEARSRVLRYAERLRHGGPAAAESEPPPPS